MHWFGTVSVDGIALFCTGICLTDLVGDFVFLSNKISHEMICIINHLCDTKNTLLKIPVIFL